MALSQIQCLDDNHVNPRNHESKAEFLYCEDQRLALETLLRDGREAFGKFMGERGLRGFLSDPELEAITGTVEPFDPNSELFPGNPAEDEPPLSLHYWPDLSDTSVPTMDLGWPDCDAYRGVTRATVYTQPPLDGQAHIKEVVRKAIAQAQKVIAVVMDVFTDVDIFRDLLDAGFKRRVSVYILLERTNLPHFFSMCRRANMHTGHLKNLRVRCTVGGEFCTRSCTKVKGQLGHRFMFVDGDKAVSGSYGFTWMASRLDRNLITVVTGQAVDAFDRLFRVLYSTSSSVDLRQMATDQEPEPEPLPQPTAVAPPSAADSRKLYNPKYALLAACNLVPPSPPKPSSPEGSNNPVDKKKRHKRGCKDTVQEEPPLHPGLVDLEKACLIPYLPTWPEPDPPSDVIGFINIRDPSKPTQVHLQRSEMFETSQAVRFSSPFTKPKEVLPEVAQPREITPKPEKINKLQRTQKEPIAVKPTVEKDQSTELQAEPCEIKTKEAPEQRTDKPDQTVKSENELHLDTTAKLPSQSSNTTTRSYSINSLNTQRVTTTSTSTSTSHNHLHVHAPPVPKPRTIQLVIKDGGTKDGQALPEISVVRRSDSVENTEPPVVTNKDDAADLIQIKTKIEPTETMAPVPENSENGAEAPDDSGIRDNDVQTPNQHQNETPNTETEEEEAVGPPDDTAVTLSPTGTNAEPQIDASTLEEPKIERQTNHDVSQEVSENESVSSSDSKTPPGTEIPCVGAVLTEIKASEEILMECQVANRTNEKRAKVIQCKTFHARAHEPQRILYCESSPALVDVDSLTMSPESRKSINTDGGSHQVNATSVLHTHTDPNLVKGDALVSAATQESQHIPQVLQNSHPPERPRHLHLTDSHVPDLHSSSAETDPEHRISFASSPTPSNDLQTPNSDPQHHPSDFRTPTTDISDGYMSPMDDSTLSTTSDEYYECSDSPFHDSVFDQEGFHLHGLTVDWDSVVHTNTTNSSLHINNTNCASTADMINSSREAQILSGQTKVCASSLLEKAEMEKERRARCKDRTQPSEGGMKQNVVERDSQETERRCSDEIKAATDQPKQEQGLTETAAKGKETQPQAAKKKPPLNRAPAQRLVDGGEIITNSTDAKRTFTGGLKFATNRRRQDKEKVANEVAYRPGDLDSSRETDRHKLLDSPAFRKPPPRPPPLSLGVVGFPAGQVNVPHGQQTPLSPQSPPVDTGMRARHSPNQHSSPKAQTFPHFQKCDVSVGDAHRQDEGRPPFTLTFSKLYNLKGLKNKVNQLPAQNRRGGGGNAVVHGSKSTG